MIEGDVLTTFNETLEVILDYDEHRVHRNLRKHAALIMGSNLRTQQRYNPKAGWYINEAFTKYMHILIEFCMKSQRVLELLIENVILRLYIFL